MLRKVFDMEGPIMSGLSATADLLVLNLITLFCCLPVLTAGAAFTALFDQCIRLARGEEGTVAKAFFQSFADNFKKSTLFWLLVLLAVLLLAADYLAALAYVPAFRVGIIAIGLIVLAVTLYAFALLARYENTLLKTLKNAASLAVAFFPLMLAMLFFTVALWVAGIRFFQIGAPVLLMFGLSLPCYVCSILLRGIFDKIEK